MEHGRVPRRHTGPELVERPIPGLNATAVAVLIAIDVLVILASFYLAGGIYDQVIMVNVGWQAIAFTTLPIYLIAAGRLRAFAPSLIARPFRSAGASIRALATAMGLIILIAFAFKTSEELSRLTLGIGTVLAFLGLPAARYIYARIMGRYRIQLSGIVLLCDQGVTEPSSAYRLVRASQLGIDPTQDDPLMYDRLAKELSGAERVIVVCVEERRKAWAHALKGANVQAEMVVPELSSLAPLGIARHDRMPTLIVSTGPLNLADRVIKRTFDLAVAVPAILVLAPVFLATAIAITLDNRGPVFFRQTRIGRGNEMFEMLKFRSMKVDALDQAGDRSTSRDDDRITRVGNFIRKTSIDELPQLFNVLRGTMSIVGPRPHALGSRAANKLFWEVDGRYWHRHSAKPGLTGLAQVRGYRGATFLEGDLTNRLQADLEYLVQWSIWRDIQIVLQTFRVLLHRNAF